jgi:CBS domain-containing protein
MKVKDIMTNQVVSVSPDAKITEVAEILCKNRFHAVPVVEEEKVIGIIAEYDFFSRSSNNVFLPSYIKFIRETGIADALVTERQEKLDKLMNLKAEDVMSKECVTILEDMDIVALLEFFRETGYTTLPVIDNKDKLIGIVTLSDILGLIKIPK